MRCIRLLINEIRIFIMVAMLARRIGPRLAFEAYRAAARAAAQVRLSVPRGMRPWVIQQLAAEWFATYIRPCLDEKRET